MYHLLLYTCCRLLTRKDRTPLDLALERGGARARRHPTVKALRQLGLRTAVETSRELRGEVVDIESEAQRASERSVVALLLVGFRGFSGIFSCFPRVFSVF